MINFLECNRLMCDMLCTNIEFAITIFKICIVPDSKTISCMEQLLGCGTKLGCFCYDHTPVSFANVRIPISHSKCIHQAHLTCSDAKLMYQTLSSLCYWVYYSPCALYLQGTNTDDLIAATWVGRDCTTGMRSGWRGQRRWSGLTTPTGPSVTSSRTSAPTSCSPRIPCRA